VVAARSTGLTLITRYFIIGNRQSLGRDLILIQGENTVAHGLNFNPHGGLEQKVPAKLARYSHLTAAKAAPSMLSSHSAHPQRGSEEEELIISAGVRAFDENSSLSVHTVNETAQRHREHEDDTTMDAWREDKHTSYDDGGRAQNTRVCRALSCRGCG
jgi:hypothetical protein